jgi:hypothetical protein
MKREEKYQNQDPDLDHDQDQIVTKEERIVIQETILMKEEEVVEEMIEIEIEIEKEEDIERKLVEITQLKIQVRINFILYIYQYFQNTQKCSSTFEILSFTIINKIYFFFSKFKFFIKYSYIKCIQIFKLF